MTDKQKIREEVERLQDLTMDKNKNFYSEAAEGEYNALCNIEHFIDSLQEEPVSIWHNSNEEQPNYASTVAIWNPKHKNGEIISRCTEVYSDRIWAYIDDLLKM